jgi:hypothetical protein
MGVRGFERFLSVEGDAAAEGVVSAYRGGAAREAMAIRMARAQEEEVVRRGTGYDLRPVADPL